MVVFPGAAATVANLLFAKDRALSYITAQITAVQTTIPIPVGHETKFAANQVLVLDAPLSNHEQVKVTSVAAGQLTVTRGVNGTTPAIHIINAQIKDIPVAAHHNLLVDEVAAIEEEVLRNTVAKRYNDDVPINWGTDSDFNILYQNSVDRLKIRTGSTDQLTFTKFSGTPSIAAAILGTNMHLRLTTNLGDSSEGADLLQLQTLQATDRTKIVFYDHLGNRAVLQNFHHTNFSDGAIHRAWEIKTNDGSGGQTTMLSIQYKTAPSDTRTIGIGQADLVQFINATEVEFRQQSNTPVFLQMVTQDSGGTQRAIGEFRFYHDGSDGTLWDLDPLTGAVTTRNSAIRLFRAVNTTGTRNIQIYQGDGSGTIVFQVDVGNQLFALGGGTGDPKLRFVGTPTPTGNADIQWLETSATARRWAFDPQVTDGTSNVTVLWFRSTNTSGTRLFQLARGDGTSAIALQFNAAAGTMEFDAATGFLGKLTHAITAARTWTYPDATGTVALMDVNNAGNFKWLSGTSFAGTLDHGATADRTWTFPDFAGDVAILSTLTNGDHPASSSYSNKGLRLTSTSTGTDFIWELIRLDAATTTTRPWISWYDSTSTRQISMGLHNINQSNGATHNAFEVKTKSSTSSMLTRFKIPYGTDLIQPSFGYTSQLTVSSDATSSTRLVLRQLDSISAATNVFQLVGALSSDDTVIDLDPLTVDATKVANLRFFRNTNTSGGRNLQLFRGDGTATLAFNFNVATGQFGWDDATGFFGTLAHAITAARTWTFPDATGTVALLQVANTFTANQTISKSDPIFTLTNTDVACNYRFQILDTAATSHRASIDINPTTSTDNIDFLWFRSSTASGAATWRILKPDGAGTTLYLSLDLQNGIWTTFPSFAVNLLASTDNARDIGATGTRWKDLYLSGNISWRSGTSFAGLFDHAISADRTWTFPDQSGTVAMTSDITALGAPVGGTYVVISADAALTNERVLTAGTGISITDAGANSTVTIAVDQAFSPTWTGTHTFTDTKFLVVDNLDASKKLAFELSGVTTATTRTLTVPNANGTIVLETRSIATGTGLSGGGDLSSDRTLTWNGVDVRKNSAGSVFTRRRLNLIEGTNVTLTVTDDAGDGEVDVTVAVPGVAPSTATFVTMSTDATLPNERVLTAGTGISIVDAGAGSTVTISTPLSQSQLQTAPTSGAEVTATAGKLYRLVFGDINLAATVTNPAFITIAVETGVGTGVFENVSEPRVGATQTVATRRGFCFPVPSGRKYKFTFGGNAGVTEAISTYNFTDIG